MGSIRQRAFCRYTLNLLGLNAPGQGGQVHQFTCPVPMNGFRAHRIVPLLDEGAGEGYLGERRRQT